MAATLPTARAVLLEWQGRSAREQAELEKRFFTSLRMPNGAYKTTLDGRLADLDAECVQQLAGRKSIALLDIGVSSGVTTLELIEAVGAAGIACEAVAADLSIHARLSASFAGYDVLDDAEGRILQLIGPWGVRGRPEREGWATPAFECVGKLLRVAAGRPQAVQLVTPRLAGRAGVEIVEQDVFSRRADWVGRFDLIRAANLLNLSYFDEDRIRGAFALLRTYLKPDGVLAVCRTEIESGVNNGTIFRVENNRLEPVVQLGSGSEVASFANSE